MSTNNGEITFKVIILCVPLERTGRKGNNSHKNRYKSYNSMNKSGMRKRPIAVDTTC